MRGKRLVAAVVAIVLGLAAAVFGSAAPAAADDAQDIHALVNQARWSQGLAGLERDSDLDRVAAAWAAEMAAAGTLSHNPNTGRQIPGGWSRWGENVAQGHATGTAMHDGWMNSPGHRANILGDFTDIGVAFVRAGGTTWGVQVFATYSGSTGVAPPPPPAAEEPAPAPPQEAAPEHPAPPAIEEPEAPASTPPSAPPASPTPTSTPTPAPTPTPTPTPTSSSPTPSPRSSESSGESDDPTPAPSGDSADPGTTDPVPVAAVAATGGGVVAMVAALLLMPVTRRIILLAFRTKPRRH